MIVLIYIFFNNFTLLTELIIHLLKCNIFMTVQLLLILLYQPFEWQIYYTINTNN